MLVDPLNKDIFLTNGIRTVVGEIEMCLNVLHYILTRASHFSF